MFDLALNFNDVSTRVSVRLNALSDAGTLLALAIPGVRRVAVVTDDRVGELYSETFIGGLRAAGIDVASHTLPQGETSKSLDRVGELFEFLGERQVGRDGVVVALGGGVVSDVAGFVAGTWMRGIPWVVVPTTLEGAIDASLGGKTAVNLPQGKNLVGVFHQPSLIIVDPACLKTLEDRDVRAGLAESIKHAVIADEAFVPWHEDNADAILAREPEVLRELILRNLRIKGEIVQRDPYERSGERALLNFGHTIGHAVERACDFSLRHGECVALGMVAACRLGEKLGITSGATTARVVELLVRFGLPTRSPIPLEVSRVLEAMRVDKKFVSGKSRFVLLSDMARPIIRADVPEDAVREVVESIMRS